MYLPFPFWAWLAFAAVLIGLETNSLLQQNMGPQALVGIIFNKLFGLGLWSEYLGGPTMGAILRPLGFAASYLPNNYDKEVSEQDLSVCGITVRQFTPSNVAGSKSQDNAAIMFIHGGGWTVGDIPTYRFSIRHIVHKTGAIVFAPDYTLAPASQYPQPLDEVECVMKWMHAKAADLHISRNRLSVMGDSAGGNLAAAVSLKLYSDKENKISIKQQVLLYPCVDASYVFSQSARKYGDAGVSLPRNVMVHFWSRYLGTNPISTLDDKLFAPLKAPKEEMKDLPPAYVLVAEHDILRSEGEAYAAKLKESGVPTELSVATGQYHAFGISVINDDAPGSVVMQKMLDHVKSKL